VRGLCVEGGVDIWELRSRYCFELLVRHEKPLPGILIIPICLPKKEKAEESMSIFLKVEKGEFCEIIFVSRKLFHLVLKYFYSRGILSMTSLQALMQDCRPRTSQ
jgi:hypothetical protein